MIQKRFGQFVASEDRGAFAEFCERAAEADTQQRCEVKLLIGDRTTHLLIAASAVRDCQGKERHCRAAVMDVTDRKAAEEALRRSQGELRAIYDHAPLLMCELDSDRHVIYLNQAMAAFIGKTEETLQRRPGLRDAAGMRQRL